MTAESNTAEMGSPYRSSGSMLRQAREEAGLAQEDVVADTRMTLRSVRALEEDDFTRLQSDTFTRGYLRIYAKLLQLDVAQLMAAYEHARRAAGLEPEPADSAPQGQRTTASGRPLWHFVVFILGLLAGLWILSVWFLGNEPDSDAPSADAVEAPLEVGLTASAGAASSASAPVEIVETSETVEAVETDVASVQEYELPPTDDEHSTSVSEVAERQSAREVVETPAPEPEALDHLHLGFVDECWLVVTDAQGDVLVTDLIQPGRELNLQGQAPFEVTMGNAHAVQLSLNGAAFDLDVPAATRLMTVSVGQ